MGSPYGNEHHPSHRWNFYRHHERSHHLCTPLPASGEDLRDRPYPFWRNGGSEPHNRHVHPPSGRVSFRILRNCRNDSPGNVQGSHPHARSATNFAAPYNLRPGNCNLASKFPRTLELENSNRGGFSQPPPRYLDISHVANMTLRHLNAVPASFTKILQTEHHFVGFPKCLLKKVSIAR